MSTNTIAHPPPPGEVPASSPAEGAPSLPPLPRLPSPHAAPARRSLRIALLGCGTVGSEVARLLQSATRYGQLVKVLVRDTSRPRPVPRSLLTNSFADILAAQPDAIIELLGGLDPATAYIKESLSRGIRVITANKSLIARRGADLDRVARLSNSSLSFEASVGAGIPILAALEHLRGDRVLAIRGVVNGSCNFILSRLAAGDSFDSALAQAKQKGLVEPDPSADISGRDSAEKLAVLAAAAGAHLDPDSIPCDGIANITPADLVVARRAGKTIKLLAELDLTGDTPRARVGPTLIPHSHPLAQLADEENGIIITTELAGDLLLRGKGAGPRPTASAILGDLARLSCLAGGTGVPPVSECNGPPRRHHLRLPPTTPAHLFSALRAHRVEPAETSLHRASARVVVDNLTPDAARRLAQALSPGDSLVLPEL